MGDGCWPPQALWLELPRCLSEDTDLPTDTERRQAAAEETVVRVNAGETCRCAHPTGRCSARVRIC